MPADRGPPDGVYEIYYTTRDSKQPFGLDSLYGTPPKLVELPEGAKPERFTVEKVTTNQYYIKINGAYLAPDGIWIRPSSTPFAWALVDWSNPDGVVIGANSHYAVWLPDKSSGWFYLILGRRDLESRQIPIGELEMYLYPEYAGSWWFKKVA